MKVVRTTRIVKASSDESGMFRLSTNMMNYEGSFWAPEWAFSTCMIPPLHF